MAKAKDPWFGVYKNKKLCSVHECIFDAKYEAKQVLDGEMSEEDLLVIEVKHVTVTAV